MFTLDTTIDAIQSAKKQFVTKFVSNQTVAAAMNQFVDAQTEYTKQATKVGMDTFNTLSQESTKAIKEASKFDFTRVSEGIMNIWAKPTKAK